jgi:hypothetical protein
MSTTEAQALAGQPRPPRKRHRNLRPSRAVKSGTTTGAVLAPLIVWGLGAAGAPLPADPVAAAAVVASLASLLTGLVAYVTPGGRVGEPD